MIVTSELGVDTSYRFMGVISPADAGSASVTRMPALRRWGVTAGAAALLGLIVAGTAVWRMGISPEPLAPRLSFVVLPFRNLSADRGNDYLADEVTDDLVASLGHIPADVVISRQSAEAVQGRPSAEIGRELNVRYLVRGSVTPENGPYHIYAELIDAARGSVVESWSFDRPREQLSDVRAEIVGYISRELNLTLDRIVDRDAGQAHDAGAAEDFYRARSRLDRDHSLAGFQAAQALLEDAVAKDPGFVAAKAELGWALLAKVTTLADPDDQKDYAEARTMIAEAMQAAPDDSTALAAYARELMVESKCGEAVSFAIRVINFEPGNLRARSTLASCAQNELRFDDAVAQYEDLLRLDPDSASGRNRHLSIATILLLQGKAPQAIVHLKQCFDDTAPVGDLGVNEQCNLFLIAGKAESGDVPMARHDYSLYEARAPGRTTWRLAVYFPAKWRELDGFKKLLAALNEAGMPVYAKENDPGPVTCGSGLFAPTPRTLPHGEVIATHEMIRRLGRGPALVIDLGHHRVEIPGGVYYADAALEDESEAAFALREAQDRFSGGFLAAGYRCGRRPFGVHGI